MKRARLTKAVELAPRLELDVSYASRRPWAPGPRLLARWAAAALSNVRKPVVLSVRIVGKSRSRNLNARYRRKDKPTNVLSFRAAANGEDYLGDIAIAYGVTSKEAKAAGKSFADHAAHLAVHGVLHLAGFDHERPKDAKVMEPLEVKILARLGIADPYAALSQ